MQFKKGDIVKIKSDGPKMTISTISGASLGKCNCVWFVHDICYEHEFELESLELVTRP